MKHILRVTLFLIISILLLSLASCGKPKVVHIEGNEVVVTASGERMDLTDETTLHDYLDFLAEEGELSFTLDGNFITGINGIENTRDTYWLFYTTDKAHANTAYGSYEWNGQTLGSASVGIDDMIVRDGEPYVFVYMKF